MATTRTLHVLLGDLQVGTLALRENEGVDFRFHDAYLDSYPRPVLGQAFLDDPRAGASSRSRLPAWFSNLLPEGLLRELVARQAGVHLQREYHLLAHLGADLPGAVRVVSEAVWQGDVETSSPPATPPDDTDWHFSLAGVQLKFSARQSERGLTIPVSGLGGDWIVKLPDTRYPDVPRNEYTTLRWAEASGIQVPEIRLVAVADIEGLPAAYRHFRETHALAMRRFDRDGERRVHMEDFAQILGLYPEEKYARWNYETQARLVLALTGEAGLQRYIRQLVFVVLSGNGDAHHKNWSLIYPDGVRAVLSPAYDLVPTVLYNPDDTLALNIGGSKKWESVDLTVFQRLARKIEFDEIRLAVWVNEAVDAIMLAWQEEADAWDYSAQARVDITAHMARLPLLRKPA